MTEKKIVREKNEKNEQIKTKTKKKT